MKCSKQMLENVVVEDQPTQVSPPWQRLSQLLLSTLSWMATAFCSIAWQLVAFPIIHFHVEFGSPGGCFVKVLSLFQEVAGDTGKALPYPLGLEE